LTISAVFVGVSTHQLVSPAVAAAVEGGEEAEEAVVGPHQQHQVELWVQSI